MINIENERLLSIKDAAAYIASRFHGSRGNRPVTLGTLYRWVGRGVRGVKLETIHVGGGQATSIEAIVRFFDAIGGNGPTSGRTVGSHTQPSSPTAPLDVKGRQRRAAAADRELEKLGI